MIKNKQLIAYWLLLGVAMLMIQVLLGGITRLTGSGLSITEWKPLLGALPPMNENEWNLLFEQYKQIAQYKILNQDFTLADFKFIYFWEWLHRNWARCISVAFIIPFVYFLWRKMITKEMVPKLLGLFALGLAQGLIGWIMVASGLNDENLYVSHIRLAIHFVSALILIAFTYWFALSLLVPSEKRVYHPQLQKITIGILCLLGLQLIYGAFMAGLKAGSFAPTWPDINGDLFPVKVWGQSFIHHPINIHFIHRMLAYTLAIVVLIWYVKGRNIKTSNLYEKFISIPLILLLLQILLGVFTVLHSIKPTRNGLGPFELLALSHQIVAMCLVMSFVWVLFMQRSRITS
ncbi:MAG: COX15/CtaA family protein [Bacteroidetes bacterium]|nr:COX15/CtaA family protein [Bacteroidota bacterium]